MTASAPPRYELHDGRILTWSLESHVVEHCNLRCVHCCTLSPALSPWSVAPGELAGDLARAARALRPSVFKVTGGEPFLHPDIVGVLEAVRGSGISEQLSLTTNGFLARRVPDAAWSLLDRLTLSRYSSAPLPEATVALVEDRCARHGIALTTKVVDAFQVLDPPAPHDEATTREIHASCWLRHRCHAISRGRFYPCTRPPHLDAWLASRGEPAGFSAGDGVALDVPELAARILELLERSSPLASCRRCLGATGAWVPHRQEPVAV